MIQRPGWRTDAGWPIALLFVGLPVWWLLGLWQIMFFVMAVPMAVHLMKRRTVRMPRGFGMWLVWLGWLFTGLLVIQVDAPGAIPGAQMSRYLTFGYRIGWYLIITIVVLYVVNTRRLVSSERISRSVSWLFVMMVGGGLLGVFAPDLSIPSLLQLILPSSIGDQQFVHDLVHIQSAQIQSFLGYDEARPSAPFAYTNEWGLATAVSLPFFVTSWWKGGRARRIAMFAILAVALFTIVSSLNRGMWGAIAAMAVFLVIRAATLGHVKLLFTSVVLLIGVATVLTFSPLGDLMLARFDNPHSDEGRTNLGLLSVNSTLEGSPIVGFGTTRDVAGNFTSIAGGATDACPKCEPPPLGTQGQLWLVVFGAGLIGLVLYLGFLLRQIVQNLRAASSTGIAALCALIALIVTMPVYNAVGVGLYVAFIGIGLLARERGDELPTIRETVGPVRRNLVLLCVASLVGGAVGFGIHTLEGTPVEATQRVFVPTTDLSGVPGARSLSLDGEALIATSAPVTDAVARALRVSQAQARASLHIGAESNTRVLLVTYTGENAKQASLGAETASDEYLAQRAALVTDANASVRARYDARSDALDKIYAATIPVAKASTGKTLWGTITKVRSERVDAAGILLNVTDADVGQVISAATPRWSNSTLTVRVATGIGIGALVGLLLAFLYDRHILRVGWRPALRLGIDIPVVAWIPSGDVRAAQHAVRGYLPVAGVVADPTSNRARRLARSLDGLLGPDGHGGSRALMVIDPRSRAGTIRRMYARYLRTGIYPVGLVMCVETGRRRRVTGKPVMRRKS